MDLLKTYDYLAKTRATVLDATAKLTPQQYLREFPFGMTTIARTLTHLMICEWYYMERFHGRDVAHYDQWPIQDEKPPAFGVLHTTWNELAPKTRAAIAAERNWTRTVEWLGFPMSNGKRFRVKTNACDLITQLALHEMHHRAQVMSMFRTMGDGVAPLQDLDFNSLMFEKTEVV